MIKQRFYIGRYGWNVTIFYAVSHYDIAQILEALAKINCPEEYMAMTADNLKKGKVNSGVTYSNDAWRCSVVVIGLCDSAEEYANSIAHERAHLVTHIASKCGLDLEGEEICYLTGDIARRMFRVSHRLVCEDCLNNLRGDVVL